MISTVCVANNMTTLKANVPNLWSTLQLTDIQLAFYWIRIDREEQSLCNVWHGTEQWTAALPFLLLWNLRKVFPFLTANSEMADFKAGFTGEKH